MLLLFALTVILSGSDTALVIDIPDIVAENSAFDSTSNTFLVGSITQWRILRVDQHGSDHLFNDIAVTTNGDVFITDHARWCSLSHSLSSAASAPWAGGRCVGLHAHRARPHNRTPDTLRRIGRSQCIHSTSVCCFS